MWEGEMKGVWRLLALSCVSGLLAACASRLPVHEVRQASAAYQAAATAGSPILDELTIAARRATIKAPPQGTPTLSEGDLTVLLTFDPKTASNYASVGEPDTVAAQRRGLKVVGAYFDVLEVLAEGRNIGEAKARIQSLAASFAQLTALVSSGAGVVLAPVIEALDPIIEATARAENAEELRRLVLDGAGPVDKLIVALEESTPQLFAVLITEAETAATGPLLKNKPARRTELLKIAGYHVSLANYVVLLEQLRVTLGTLVSAVHSPSGITLALLSETANDLQIQAGAVLRAYAILRRPIGGVGAVEVTP